MRFARYPSAEFERMPCARGAAVARRHFLGALPGSPWRDLPARYGSWQTMYDRFRKWQRNGTIDRIMKRLQLRLGEDNRIGRGMFVVDRTIVRAHQSAAGARKNGSAQEPQDHALGRSRGGFTTKLHLVFERGGLPLSTYLNPGHRHDSLRFEHVMNQVQIPRRAGRPESRPACLGAGKGYSYPPIRRCLRDCGIRAVIPQRNAQRAHQGGRPLAFSKQLYRSRNITEYRINWIKNCRRLPQRYGKNALCYLAMVKLHSFVLT